MPKQPSSAEKVIAAAELKKDVVCGMDVAPDSPYWAEHDGTRYVFCSPACLEKFRQVPDRYVAEQRIKEVRPRVPREEQARRSPPAEYTCPMHPDVKQSRPGTCPKCGMALEPVTPKAPTTATKWTCPMHPEIVRDQPGSCPICGMALEPMTVAVAEEENAELRDMTRRLWVGTVLTVPLVLIAMGDYLPGRPFERVMAPGPMGWLELILATPVVLWCGWPFFIRGWQSVINRSLKCSR